MHKSSRKNDKDKSAKTTQNLQRMWRIREKNLDLSTEFSIWYVHYPPTETENCCSKISELIRAPKQFTRVQIFSEHTTIE